MLMPFLVLGMLIRHLFGIAVIGLGIYFVSYWYNHREMVIVEQRTVPQTSEIAPEGAGVVITTRESKPNWNLGLNTGTAVLVGGIGCLIWSFGGGSYLLPLLFRRKRGNEPTVDNVGQLERLLLPDGSELQIASTGPAGGEPVIFIHGWSLNKDEWCYARKLMSERFRVVTWDLPGLGKSSRPANFDWSMETLAKALEAVIARTPGKPVTLVGHSIGVMVILTYCRLFPEQLGTKVKALVLGQGTYTNPVKTTKGATLYTALQKPLIEPVCHLMIWLSPFVHLMNWIGYLNGSMQRSTERVSFSGKETRGQLNFLTWHFCKAIPAVVGHGMLGMLRFDETETLPRIHIPTLVVAGDKDETCLPSASQFMAERIPNARLTTMVASKHCGLFEHPEEFNRLVTEFITSVASAESTPAKGPVREQAGAIVSR
jgi:pimeloyl-ACP methyl ester carboxylesterase